MATTMARRPIPPLAIGFGAILAITIGGFWNSFFSNPLSNDAAHIVHGAAATGWILLLMTQSLLIAGRRGKLHMAIGRWSPLLVGVLVVSALMMVRSMMEATYLTPELRLNLAASDIFGLTLFVALYCAAIAYRRDRGLHSRLMGLTVLTGVPPAMARLLPHGDDSWATSLVGRLHITYIFIELVLVVLILIDARRGQLRWPLPATLVAFLLIHWAIWQAPGWSWFMALVRGFGFAG